MNFEQKPQESTETQTEKTSRAKEISPEKREKLSRELLDISPETLLALKERIRENQGHVQLSMHPFYARHHHHELNVVEISVPTQESNKSKQQLFVEDGFVRIARHAVENPASSPLLIFEEEAFILDARQCLSVKLDVPAEEFESKGIYFVPTLHDSGVVSYQKATRLYDQAHDTAMSMHNACVKVDNLERDINANARLAVLAIRQNAKSREEYETTKNEFVMQFSTIMDRIEESRNTFRAVSNRVLYHLMKDLEVQSVNMSGGYFKKGKKEEGSYSVMPDGCAGYIRTQLRSFGVDVNLSKYTIPSRDSIKKLDPITKDTRDMHE